MSDLTRRTFLGHSALVASYAMSGSLQAAPGNRLTVALIGCGGMGSNHLQLLASRTDLRLKY
ncbi:MAG: hypothetical protein B7Z55_15030, partial [Planctomycetales bacterium 12-60-4]